MSHQQDIETSASKENGSSNPNLGARGGRFLMHDSYLPIHPHLKNVAQSPTLRISEQSAAILSQDPQARVYKFGLGQSPFPVMKPLVDSLREHAPVKDYLPTAGYKGLRETIAHYASKRCGEPRTADDVLIGDGTKVLLFLLQMSLDADLLVPSPSWVTYEPQAQMLGRRTLWVETHLDEAWKVHPEDLEDTLRYHTQFSRNYAKLFVLNYPSNPTGATYTAEELKSLADVFRRHGVLVLSDEIYCRYTFNTDDEENRANERLNVSEYPGGDPTQCAQVNETRAFTKTHHSIAEFYPEGTIILDGISKWAGAGGWRLGAFVFPPKLNWLRATMLAAASETYSSVCAPVQIAAMEAFKESNDEYIDRYVDASNKILSFIASFVTHMLRKSKAKVRDPRGGFYVFADFSDCPGIEKARKRFSNDTGLPGSEMTSEWLASDILSRTGVAMLPGSAFGCLPTSLLVRMAYVDFNGANAMKVVDSRIELSESTTGVSPDEFSSLPRFYYEHPRGQLELSDLYAYLRTNSSHKLPDEKEWRKQSEELQSRFLLELCPNVYWGMQELSKYLTSGEGSRKLTEISKTESNKAAQEAIDRYNRDHERVLVPNPTRKRPWEQPQQIELKETHTDKARRERRSDAGTHHLI